MFHGSECAASRPCAQPQAPWGLERDRPGSSEVVPMSHPARLLRLRLASSCPPEVISHTGVVGVWKLGRDGEVRRGISCAQ